MKANVARLKWIRNVAAAGGIAATAPASSASDDAPFDAAALAADWSAARTPLAIIAAADHDENELRAGVGALADAGATVWLVGPGAAPTASARVIDPAQDVLALLADAHAALGIAP